MRSLKHCRQILSKLLLRTALKKFGSDVSLDLTTIPETWQILLVVSHFNLSVLAYEMLSVSLLWNWQHFWRRTNMFWSRAKFSGFLWERILFLNSACVNMVMQIQVQIADTRRVGFFMNPPGSVKDLKKLQFAWNSENSSYGFWFTLRKW